MEKEQHQTKYIEEEEKAGEEDPPESAEDILKRQMELTKEQAKAAAIKVIQKKPPTPHITQQPNPK
jgi:hypothetical protein